MRALLFLVFFVAFAVCFGMVMSALPSALSVDRQDYPELFQEWKEYFGKTYSTAAEEDLRFANFVSSIDQARSRNQAEGSNAHGLNPFSDLSQDEFASLYLMRVNVKDLVEANFGEVENMTLPLDASAPLTNPRGETIGSNSDSYHRPAPGAYAPNTLYDWQYNGYVSAVKDQKQCGSCWAFSATEQIESNYALLRGSLPALLSTQQMVDCDSRSYGCNGGWPVSAYNYIKNAGGQSSEAAYPYTAKDGQCRSLPKIVKVTGYKVVGQNNEAAMLSHLLSGGPLSICLDATSMSTYGGNDAILQPNSCSPNNINHCVQLTGFLTDASGNIKAWNTRNSWGTWWGNNGYSLLKYGSNTCGIAYFPTIVTVQ